MYYVLVNKYKIPVPYWTWADAQKAIQTVYRVQYPVSTLRIIYEKQVIFVAFYALLADFLA